MSTNKVDYIENYFYNHHEDDFFYVALHSLFNCISDEELMILYFQNARENPNLKKTIERYIIRRTTNEPKRQFDNIAKTLLSNYSEQDYHTQIKIRTFLAQFVRTLPVITIRSFFYLLIKSERKFDRHRANEVADLIWDDEIEGYLIDNFTKYSDEYSLFPLIKNLDKSSLCLLAEKYWTKDFPSMRQKSIIVKKIAELEIEFLSFLKERDVSFYIQALTIKRIEISDIEIKLLLKSMTEQNKYYLIWSLGMTGKWKQTVRYIEKINAEKRRGHFQ